MYNLKNFNRKWLLLPLLLCLAMVSCAGLQGVPIRGTPAPVVHEIRDSVSFLYRGDTVYVENWHNEVHQTPYEVEVVREVAKPIPRIYRYCAWFTATFILVIGILIFYSILRLRYA